MKKLLVLSLVLTSAVSFARVGIERFSHTVTGDTEEIVLEKVEVAIPKIQRGKIKSPFQTNCWPNNKKTIKIKSVVVNKAYNYNDGEMTPYYVGRIGYIHKRCRD